MNLRAKTTVATTYLVMIGPKMVDELEDLFDEDPATLFSWQFMLALLLG
jgi:hypothetical protein